jgi:hypothetical protein
VEGFTVSRELAQNGVGTRMNAAARRYSDASRWEDLIDAILDDLVMED